MKENLNAKARSTGISPPRMEGKRVSKFVFVLAAVFLLMAGMFAAPALANVAADEPVYKEVNSLDELKAAIDESNRDENLSTEYLIVINNDITVTSGSTIGGKLYDGFAIYGKVTLTTNKTGNNMLIWSPGDGESTTPYNNPMFSVSQKLSASQGGQLTIRDNSTGGVEAKVLTLKGVSTDSYHPVISVGSDSEFIMNGGKITGHYCEGQGGAVFNSGYFKMSGTATIEGNKALKGGGVFNEASNVDGDNGFYMEGGSIIGNTALELDDVSGYGGGVYNAGYFMMSAGTIGGLGDDANTAGKDGGGVYNEGEFRMSGTAVIAGNEADDYGGGVYNGVEVVSENNELRATSSLASFYMGGGSIIKNTADYGSGVYNAGEFRMSESAVIGGEGNANTATTNGGGVYNAGEFVVTGSPKVTGNTVGDSKNNVYIPAETETDNYWIQIVCPLDDAKIGVTHQKQGEIELGKKETDKTVAIQSDGNIDSSYTEFFPADGCPNFVTEFREVSRSIEGETYQERYIVLTKYPKLTWNFDGGVASGDYTEAGFVKAGTEIIYPTVSKSGYVSDGWDTEITTMPAENTVITALWKPEETGGDDDSPKGSVVWLQGNPGPFEFKITELIIFYVTMPYDYMGSVKLIAKSGVELPPGLEALAAADIALTEEMKEGQKAKVTAKVPQFLLDGNNVKPEDIALYQLIGDEWVKLDITWWVDEFGYVHFETETDLIGLFVLVIENGGVKPTGTSETESPLSVLAVLGGLGAASVVIRRK